MKARGAWKFASRTLSSNIPVVENVGGARAQPFARDDRDHQPAGARDDCRPSRDNRDGGGQNDSRPGGQVPPRHGGDVGSSSSDRHDDYRRGGSSNGSDYHGGRDEYSRIGSGMGSGDQDRGPRGRDDDSRGRNDSSRDWGRNRTQDRDEGEIRPTKRFRGPSDGVSASTVPAPALAADGRGRGTHRNRPAWMTQGNGPTGISNVNSPANNLASALAAETGAAPSVASSGAGRGRDNRPAWMTQQQGAPVAMPSNLPRAAAAPPSNVAAAAPPQGGAGRGRGTHRNRPAWMTQQQDMGAPAAAMAPVSEHVSSNHPPETATAPRPNGPAWMGMPQQQRAPAAPGHANFHAVDPSRAVNSRPVNGRGRGRGRGKDRNKPAWMTNPSNA